MSWVFFKKQHRRKRSHGHSNIDTYVNLIDSIDQPHGVHKMKTMLFSVSLLKLRELQSLVQESKNNDYESSEYRNTAIISDAPHIGCSDLSPVIS